MRGKPYGGTVFPASREQVRWTRKGSETEVLLCKRSKILCLQRSGRPLQRVIAKAAAAPVGRDKAPFRAKELAIAGLPRVGAVSAILDDGFPKQHRRLLSSFVATASARCARRSNRLSACHYTTGFFDFQWIFTEIRKKTEIADTPSNRSPAHRSGTRSNERTMSARAAESPA